MLSHYHYTTVLDALKNLKRKGFVHDFNLNHETIVKNPKDYRVELIYRHEEDTDLEEEAIVYGIESIEGVKGVFVSGDSTNSKNEASQIIKKLSFKNSRFFNLW